MLAMAKLLLASVAILSAVLVQGSWAATFTFKNNCPYTVWPGTLGNGGMAALPQTGFELAAGGTLPVAAPAGWRGRMWARTQCSTDAAGKFTCVTGDCGTGQVACAGSGGSIPTTITEFTLQGDGGKDFYDVSNVDGFNVPVSVAPQGGPGCSSTACAANINAVCPAELRLFGPDGRVAACKSACAAFNTDEYCCRGQYGSPTTCHPTNYSQIFKSECPQAYSYAYDDGSSTFTCLGADGYVITYCP